MYLLDTTILWELRKPRRNPNVVSWIAAVPAEGLHLSVITIGEIAKGISTQRRAGTASATASADNVDHFRPSGVPVLNPFIKR